MPDLNTTETESSLGLNFLIGKIELIKKEFGINWNT